MTFQRLTLLVSTASLIILSFGLIVMFGISIHEKNAEREGYQLALILGRIPLCASLLESEMVVRLRDFIQCETQDCLEDMWVAPSNVTLEAVRRFDKEWSVTARALRATTVFTPHVSFFDSFREQLVTCRTRRTVLASMSAYAELLHLLVQLSHKVQWEPALNTALHHMNSFSHSVARRLLAYTTTLMFSAASSLSVYETERSQSADARVAVQEVTGLIGTFDVMTGVIAPMRESALSILEVPIVESDIQRTLRSLFQLLEETNNRVVNLVSQSVLSNDTLRDFQTTQRLSQYVIEHGTLQHELVQASNSQFENTILLRRFYRGLHIGLLLLGWVCSLAGAVLHIYLLTRQRKNEAVYQVLLPDFVIHEARGAVEITETTMNTIKAMTERIKFLDDPDEFLDESLTPRKSEISTAKVSTRSSNLLHSPSHEAEECGLLSSHPSHHTKASKSRSQIELTLWKALTVLRELRPFVPRGAFLFDTESVTLCSRFGRDPMASSGELYNGSKQVGDGCMELNSADQTSSHRLASVTSNNSEHPNLSFGNPWSETEFNNSMSLMRIKKLNLSTRLCARTVTLLLIQRHVESDDEFSDAGPYSELLKQVDTVVNRYGGIVLHMNQDGVTVLFNAMIDTVTSQQSPQQATTDALFSAFVLSQVLGTVDTREEAFSIVLCHGQACVGNLTGHMTTSFQVVGAPVLRALYFGPIAKRHRCPIVADHESSQILKDVGCFVRPIECLSVKCSTIQAAGSSAVTVNSYAGTKSTRTPEPSTREVVYEILGIPECLYESYTRRSSLAHGLDLALSYGAYLWSPRGPKLRVTCEELLAGLTIWNRAWEMYEKSRGNLTDQFEEVLKELIKYRDSYLKGHNGIRGIDVSFDLLYGLILSRLKDLLGDDYELEHTGE